jgi:hypothetical protein
MLKAALSRHVRKYHETTSIQYLSTKAHRQPGTLTYADLNAAGPCRSVLITVATTRLPVIWNSEEHGWGLGWGQGCILTLEQFGPGLIPPPAT